MTYKLVEILKNEYPPINNFERVSIYGAYERIYLDLISKDFLNGGLLKDSKKIFELAQKLFDVPFTFGRKGDLGEIIYFEPSSSNKYEQNHFAHYIKVEVPSNHPMITISTANRGAGELFKKQRDNYFKFVNETYNLFLKNAE